MFQGSGFGSSTPFSGSTFGKPTTSAFGTPSAPVFGSSGGSSLFGTSTQQQQPASTGFFGSTTFGQPQTSQSTFGAFGGGTTQFGQQANANTTGGGLFGSTPFGGGAGTAGTAAKPGGFTGFGTTSQPSTVLFGAQPSTPQQTPTLFGQAPNQTAPSIFSGFGANAGGGGTTIKFTPVTGTDTMMKNGQSSTISTRHHCITCMKEYENKSLEELRMEDYAAGRKGGATTGGGLFGAGSSGTGGLFGATSQPSTGLFGSTNDNKSLFGQTNTGFGTGTMFGGTSNTGNNVFGGKPVANATPFGTTSTSTTSSFGFSPQTTNTMFGNTQNTAFFGNTASTGSAFGTQTTSFTPFSSNQQQGGLFNQNKSNFTLGNTTTNQGFQFGGSTLPSATNTGSAFAPAKPGFGGFGTQATTTTNTFTSPFGTPASSTQSSFFNSSNNFKGPSAFAFGQTATSSNLGTGLNLGGNTGSSLFGNTQKPGGLFGNTNTSMSGGNQGGFNAFGGFGNLGSSTTSFGTLGGNTLGGGLFGQPQQQQAVVTQPVNNQLNQQMLALASMPFGDSPLFKNLLPLSSNKNEEAVKATSPAAQRALATGVNYKVSPKSTSKLKHVRPTSVAKTSLFEGLDDDEANNNDVTGTPNGLNTSTNDRIRNNVRRLTLRPRLDQTNSPPASADTSNWVDTTISPSSPFTLLMKKKLLSSPVVDSPSSPSTQGANTNADESTMSRRHVSFAPGVGASSTPAIHKIPSSQSITSSVASASSPSNLVQSRLGLDSLSGGSSASITSPSSPSIHNTSGVGSPISKMSSSALNKDMKDSTPSSSADSDSDSDSVQGHPTKHPTGIVLRRSGYYTIPSLADLAHLMDSQGRCIVDNFTVGRLNYGNVFYPDSFDVANLDLDKIVHFRHKEVVVYPDDTDKPPVGQGLNRRAQVTLDRVWPIDRTTREVISDSGRIAALDFENKLRTASAKHGTRFIEYRPQTGSWVFKVEHFSKYGLSDSDEDDSGPAINTSQISSATAAAMEKKRLAAKQQALGFPTPLAIIDPKQLEQMGEIEPLADQIFMEEDDEEMADNISGQAPFDILEVEQMLSPTSKLGRQLGSSAQKLQLMKASFFHEDNQSLRENGSYDVKAKIGNLMKSFEAAAAAAVADTSMSSAVPGRLLFGCDSALPSMQGSFMIPSPRPQKISKPPSPTPSECMDEDTIADEEDSILIRTERSPDLESPMLLNQGLPWLESTAGRASELGPLWAADLGLGGIGFRPGWSSETLTILATPAALASPASLYCLDGRAGPLDNAPTALAIVRLASLSSSQFKDAVVKHLEGALNFTEIEMDQNGFPKLCVKDAIETLEEHCQISSSLSLDNESTDPVVTVLSMHRDVWSLCKALWSPLMDEGEVEDLYSRTVLRRMDVCQWLESVVRSRAVSEAQRLGQTSAAVFSLMTCHDVSAACDLAISIGDINMSLIASQAGYGCRELIGRQLKEWKETYADRHIDPARLKVYALASGSLSHKTSFDAIECCQGLDWLRAFGLNFWYVSWCTASVGDALEVYDLAWKKHKSAAPPFACEDDIDSDDSPLSLLYHLLKLYTDKGHPLEKLLDTATHSPDPLDYSLSWLLMRVLTALGYSHLSETNVYLITNGFASQLESLGLWHWAVYVLLHLDTPILENLICNVIERHIAKDEDTTKEVFLKENLNVPDAWIARSKATAYLIAGRYEEAADNLIISEDWDAAHEVIMDNIVSKAIVNERYSVVESLLKRVEAGGGALAASKWTVGGSVILDYLQAMHLAEQIASKMHSKDPITLRQQMIATAKLDETVSSLTDRISRLPVKKPIDRLCHTEMGERLARLGSSTPDRAQNLAQLPLPPDFSQSHWIESSESFVPS